MLNFLHLLVYSWNGEGVPVFDIFGMISHMFAEVSMTVLVSMIASGWTLSYKSIDWDNNLDIWIPVGAIVLAIHLILAAMTYVDIDAYHKYHDYAGVQGIVLVVLKLLMSFYFFYNVYYNKDTIPRKALGFYKQFLFLATLYLLSVPMTISCLFLFAPYNRQSVYFFMTNFVQVFSMGVMLQ